MRNWLKMSMPRAPTLMRKPISLVRSVTLTYMMFMMPIPPTISEMPAIHASRMVNMSIVLVIIELSDIVFAFDSVPAVFSVTSDPYIVFFSNIFAIMGLRSLFFMLESVLDKFWFLKIGLSILLTFIGVKMLLPLIHLHIGTVVSLCVILGILSLSIVISLLFPKKRLETLD